MSHPYLRVADTGATLQLDREVTTVGRGSGLDLVLADPTVSRLHAEVVRRGEHVYVSDLGLSQTGTRVNGRPVLRRLLHDGDVVSFGDVRVQVLGVPRDGSDDGPSPSCSTPELTRREIEVLTALCRPALAQDAFVAPASAREVAQELVVTEAAIKQHLLRLYQKFGIAEGVNRRTRLANEVIARGIVRPLPLPAAQVPA